MPLAELSAVGLVEFALDARASTKSAGLEKLAARPEHEIDTSNIREWTDKMWASAQRGKFYRPIKKAVSLRLNADVIAWQKKMAKGELDAAREDAGGIRLANRLGVVEINRTVCV